MIKLKIRERVKKQPKPKKQLTIKELWSTITTELYWKDPAEYRRRIQIVRDKENKQY